MGAQMIRLQTLLSVVVASCVHVPPPVTPISLTHAYLTSETPQLTGNTKHVINGMWCADDDAFALPVVPFPSGPTEIEDPYEGGGVTCRLMMFDAHESLVEIIRTKIRPDLQQEGALQDVARSIRGMAEGVPGVTTKWVLQKGMKHLQQVNPYIGYQGRTSVSFLRWGQTFAAGPSTSCRVDRHFMGAGYYFQVIAAVHRIEPVEDSCKVAHELAAWTVENIRVGRGCDKPPN